MPICINSRCTPRRTSMARSDWRPSIRGLRGIGEMIGMAATMPEFVHGLNLFLEGDF
jgi:hypothetical protein